METKAVGYHTGVAGTVMWGGVVAGAEAER